MFIGCHRAMPQLDQLTAALDRVAAFDPGPFPVVSLYLNLQPDQQGRNRFDAFLRKELTERVRTYAASGPERESLDTDAAKIEAYVRDIPGSRSEEHTSELQSRSDLVCRL